MVQKQAGVTLTGDEVARHNSKDSCWVIVHGKAYDVTEFLPGRTSSRWNSEKKIRD